MSQARPRLARTFAPTCLLLALVSLLASLLGGCQGTPSGPSPDAQALAGSAETPVERGRYLVAVLGCHDCHTPFKMGPNGPEPDMTRMLSGHPQDLVMPPPPALPPEGPWNWVGSATNTAYAGPWGISYSTNLTPEEVSGMGVWTEEMFLKSIKTGKHWGEGRPIQPPMPWPSYSQLRDDDLEAIYAYLRSIPPIKNEAPATVVAPPPAS